MAFNQFVLRNGDSRELESFPHIREFALRKNNTIQLDSFVAAPSGELRMYCVVEGKFEWSVNRQNHVLYPGNIAFVLPGQEIGGSRGQLDIGTFISLYVEVEKMFIDGMLMLGKWSRISDSERLSIGRIMLMNKLSVLKMRGVGDILQEMYAEICQPEIGHETRVNGLLDSLLIMITRQTTRQGRPRMDFPGTFTRLEQTLRGNLAHQWTVEEMAALVGLRTTVFTEKVKDYTGFSPLSYLINIRISEATMMLQRPHGNVTEIALETGFYSSQHFSTTFKKLTGHTPGEFRKRMQI